MDWVKAVPGFLIWRCCDRLSLYSTEAQQSAAFGFQPALYMRPLGKKHTAKIKDKDREINKECGDARNLAGFCTRI